MKKLIVTTTLLGLTATGIVAPALRAQAGTRACVGWEYRVDRRTPQDVRDRRMRRLIGCVFDRVGIPGEIDTARAIAYRESRYAPWAHNTLTDCRGLFQHMGRYWHGRVRSYLSRAQFPRFPDVSAFDARANTWVAARMVKASGWGAWSTR